MRINEILDEWENDAPFGVDLMAALHGVPKLHSKYMRLLVSEKVELVKREEEMKRLRKLKHDWYAGTMDDERLRELGWEPNRLRIVRGDLGMAVDADEDVSQMSYQVNLRRERVKALDTILGMVTFRSNAIKAAMEHQRFLAGQ